MTKVCSSRSKSFDPSVQARMLIFRFTASFSAAVAKLFELGVPSQQWATSDPWIMQTLDEQSEQKK